MKQEKEVLRHPFNRDIYKITLIQKSSDGLETTIVKTRYEAGAPWPELLADFVDALRALGYSIPLTYDDIINLPSSNSFEDKPF